MNAMVPYKDMEAMAADVVRGGLFPGIKTVPQALTLFLVAQAEGLHPMTAAIRYNIIQNRPALKADAMLAAFMERGGTVKWIEWTNEVCEAEFKSTGCPDGVIVRWTMEDANKAGVTSNPTWKKYPRQMLKARVASDGVRMADPNVNYGRYTPEEVQDDKPKAAEFEVLDGGGSESGHVGEHAPPPSIQSATGLSTEEHLAEAKNRREEAVANHVVAPGKDDISDEEAALLRRALDDKRHGRLIPDHEVRPHLHPAKSGPVATDPTTPIERLLEQSIEDIRKKHGRPKSVPDYCTCQSGISKYTSSAGDREYFECDSRHAFRYDFKTRGEELTEKHKASLRSHFFKDAGKVVK